MIRLWNSFLEDKALPKKQANLDTQNEAFPKLDISPDISANELTKNVDHSTLQSRIFLQALYDGSHK